MRSIITLLVLCLALSILLGAGFVRPGPERVRPHTDFPAMQHTTGGPAGGVLVGAGLGAGILVIGIMGTCAVIGIGRSARHAATKWIVGWVATYSVVFAALVWTDVRVGNDATVPFIGGFPPPTAWLIYGIWLIPWLPVLAFVWRFDRWYFSPEDEARFTAMVERARAGTESRDA